MRRGRIFFYLAFIIILGLVAFVVIWQRYLNPPAAGPGAPAPTPVINTVNVIVVTQKVPRGTAVSSAVLGMVPIPQELFYEGMFTNIADVEGRLAKFDLEAGVPLTRGMLVDTAEQLSTTGSVTALSIPRGMVAVSIPISRLSSVSYAPRPGDHVNVIVTMLLVDLDPDFQTQLPNRNVGVIAPGTGTGNIAGSGAQAGAGEAGAQFESASLVAVSSNGVVGRVTQDPLLGQTFYHVPAEERQRPRMVSQNLLQDVVVLHVGNFPYEGQVQPQTAQAETAEGQPAPGEGGNVSTTPPPDVITLIVSPQDAVALTQLLYSGAQLTLALRSAGDDTRVQTESVTLQYLLEQYNITIPAKLPTGMEPPVRELKPPVLPNDAIPTPAP